MTVRSRGSRKCGLRRMPGGTVRYDQLLLSRGHRPAPPPLVQLILCQEEDAAPCPAALVGRGSPCPEDAEEK